MEEQEIGEKLEMKKAEWESFIRKAKVKTANHTTMVRFYNAVYNFMIMTVILIAGEF
jgi:putative alpha-1,2-mannosidase